MRMAVWLAYGSQRTRARRLGPNLKPEIRTHNPYTLHPSPYALHPTSYTLHPTPYTLHPTPAWGVQGRADADRRPCRVADRAPERHLDLRLSLGGAPPKPEKKTNP